MVYSRGSHCPQDYEPISFWISWLCSTGSVFFSENASGPLATIIPIAAVLPSGHSFFLSSAKEDKVALEKPLLLTAR